MTQPTLSVVSPRKKWNSKGSPNLGQNFWSFDLLQYNLGRKCWEKRRFMRGYRSKCALWSQHCTEYFPFLPPSQWFPPRNRPSYPYHIQKWPHFVYIWSPIISNCFLRNLHNCRFDSFQAHIIAILTPNWWLMCFDFTVWLSRSSCGFLYRVQRRSPWRRRGKSLKRRKIFEGPCFVIC